MAKFADVYINTADSFEVKVKELLFENWFYHLLRMIPEAIGMVALGTALIKEKYTLKQILLSGALIGVVGFLSQRLPIKYGVHIPMGIIVFMLVLNLGLKLNILRSAAAALLTFIVLTVIEVLSFNVQTKIFGYSEKMLAEGSDVTRFVFSLPPLCFLLILGCCAQIWLRLRSREAVR